MSPPSLQVNFRSRDGYLEAVLEGLASLEGAQAALAATGAEAARQDAPRVLINCLGILGQTSHHDHAQIGLALARYLGQRRCALLTAPPKIQGVMGAAAQDAGAIYRAFGARDDALAWLRA